MPVCYGRDRHCTDVRMWWVESSNPATLTAMTALRNAWPIVAGVAALVLVAMVVLRASRVPHPFAPAAAVLRGSIQLAVISVVLSGVITNVGWVAVALLVMFTIAAVTATRRIGWNRRKFGLVASSMASGVVTTLVIVFTTGAVSLSGRYLLALGGIIVGNSMSIATLAGRHLLESVDERWAEVEGWLALGATPRQSTYSLSRRAVYSALIPTTDQTKTTGLVTLPGAFIGAIFGGVSPAAAAQFQILVLAGVMAAGSITAVMIVNGLAAVERRPTSLA